MREKTQEYYDTIMELAEGVVFIWRTVPKEHERLAVKIIGCFAVEPIAKLVLQGYNSTEVINEMYETAQLLDVLAQLGINKIV